MPPNSPAEVGALPFDDADPYIVADNIADGAERLRKFVPSRFTGADPTNPEVRQWVTGVLARVGRGHYPVIRKGPSLLVLGVTGAGKTFQAYGGVKALALSGAACRWTVVTAADAYARLRPRTHIDSEAEFRHIADVPVLVLDDLGAAKTSDWTEEVNYRLINHRYQHELATVITSNVPVGKLKAELGDRVTSRLAEMATRAVLTGPDRRRTTTTEENQ